MVSVSVSASPSPSSSRSLTLGRAAAADSRRDTFLFTPPEQENIYNLKNILSY